MCVGVLSGCNPPVSTTKRKKNRRSEESLHTRCMALGTPRSELGYRPVDRCPDLFMFDIHSKKIFYACMCANEPSVDPFCRNFDNEPLNSFDMG